MPGTLGRSAGLALAFLLIAMPSTAEASAVDLFGYGARGMGTGGLAVSTARGPEAVYYNPAGLAFDPRPSFAVIAQHARLELEINGDDAGVRSAPATALGVALPLPLRGWWARRLGVAMGFVVPQTSLLIADLPRPGQPYFPVLGARAHTLSLQAGLGFRPFEQLAVGAGALALATVHGVVDVAPNEFGLVGSVVRNKVIARYAPVLSAQWHSEERWSLGVMWRGESKADFDFPVQADLGETFPLPVPALDISGTAQFDPAQLWVEVAFRPTSGLQLALAATWKRWSGFDQPIAYTATPEDHPPLPDPGFTDTLVLRAGGEGRVDAGPFELEPRLALVYEPTGAPEQRGLHNHLDSDRWIATAGLALRWQNLHLALAGQVHEVVERNHEKDPNLLATPDESPGWPAIRHQGRILVIGLELGASL